MGSTVSPHIVIFPFMAQGHTLPLLDLSKTLSNRHITVTIITTPSNAISIAPFVANYPSISLCEIPFPTVSGLPNGCENTSQLPSMATFLPFLYATKQLQKPFEEVLLRLSKSAKSPVCVISDFFLGFTLASCRNLGIPRLVFHGMGVISMTISKVAWDHALQLSSENEYNFSDLFGIEVPFILTKDDMPDILNAPNHDDLFSKFLVEAVEADLNSWGIVVNSFVDLEGIDYVSSLESIYKNGGANKAWCIGPLFLYDQNHLPQNQQVPVIKWLDEQITKGSIIYASFGTQAGILDAELDELALGLENSGFKFILVVRSTKWTPPDVKYGFIIREWVDQRSILMHQAVGGFLSHCGWNSVLEGLSVGLPILAWPIMADQFLNAKVVVEGLRAGLRVNRVEESVETGIRVSRGGVCEGVKELMGGEIGGRARERAEEFGRMARKAVREGGSSYVNLDKLVDQLCMSLK